MPTRVARWESRTEVPLLLLAVAFLVSYAWTVLDTSLEPSLEVTLEVVSWAVWAAFALDFAVRVALAVQRWAYIRTHWYDAVLIAVPLLRPLRLLRALALARMLGRSVGNTLVSRVSIYVTGTAIAAVGLGALAVLDAERSSPEANITSFGDAVWWATATVTTVGYGDRYPVTGTGRMVAVGLMLIGIAVVSSLTATVATWLLSNVDRTPETPEAES